MKFQISYHYLVSERDVPNLPEIWRGKVRLAIEARLTTHPDLYGKPLRRSIKGYRKLRVGDYRVIFRIERQVVKIILIGHRSVVYKEINKRI